MHAGNFVLFKLNQMERPASKDKVMNAYVDELELELKKIKENVYFESYISIKMSIDILNMQIRKLGSSLDPEDDKGSQNLDKMASRLQSRCENIEFFRSKLIPSEIAAADKKAKELITKDEGVEQYLRTKQ